MTQRELADALGYTPQAISRFESLDSGFPFEYVGRLCEIFDLSMDDMFDRRNEGGKDDGNRIEPEDLSRLIRDARSRSGKTQGEVAATIGASERSLRNFEQGKTVPSWQTVEAICFALGIRPSGLVVPDIPTTVLLARKPSLFANRHILSMIAVALCFLVLALPDFASPVSVAEIPSSSFASEVSPSFVSEPPSSSIPGHSSTIAPIDVSSVTSPASVSSSFVPRYGIDMEDGVPGFVALKAEKQYFQNLGESIELEIVDPYDGHDLADTLTEEDFRYEAISATGEPVDVTFAPHDHDKCTMTLNDAKNGASFSLHVHIRGMQGDLGYFYYWSGKDVYLSDDAAKEHPFSSGRLINSGLEEIIVNMNQSRALRYHIELGGEPHTTALSKSMAFYPLNVPRHPDHDFSELEFIDYQTIALPKYIESDEIVLALSVEINDGGETRFFALKPLHIHLVWA